jgi:hypothetical protein
MVDATDSCVRIRELMRPDRAGAGTAAGGVRSRSCASHRRASTDAASIGAVTPLHPGAASSRPAVDASAAPTI